MSEIALRIGTDADIDTAIEIYIEASLARAPEIPRPASWVEHARENMRRPGELLLVADDNGVTAGFGLGEPYRDEDGEVMPGIWYVAMIFIRPAYWSAGLGGRITAALIEAGADRGYETIRLWTQETNTRAQALYERLGFMRNGREHPTEIGEQMIEYERPAIFPTA